MELMQQQGKMLPWLWERELAMAKMLHQLWASVNTIENGAPPCINVACNLCILQHVQSSTHVFLIAKTTTQNI
jgi:hypothetical protein